MIRHVLFTGEIGAGKSTALRETLALLDMPAWGIETYSPEPRDAQERTLCLRAFGSGEQGVMLCKVPGGNRSDAAALLDTHAAALLDAAQNMWDESAEAGLIVIDEIGRLERDALRYQAALRDCLDGNRPVLGVLRKHQASWADWIREREDVLLLEVTPQNRDALPERAAEQIRWSITKGKRKTQT